MGSRTEKLLLEDARELGYEGIKVDMGGYGGYKTGHDAGDLIIGKHVPRFEAGADFATGYLSDAYVIEEKYKSTDANKYLQEDGEKFDAMIEFAEAFGATPVLAVRWSSNLEWSPGAYHLLIDARKVERTKAGNVSVKPQTAIDKFERPEDFFGP